MFHHTENWEHGSYQKDSKKDRNPTILRNSLEGGHLSYENKSFAQGEKQQSSPGRLGRDTGTQTNTQLLTV